MTREAAAATSGHRVSSCSSPPRYVSPCLTSWPCLSCAPPRVSRPLLVLAAPPPLGASLRFCHLNRGECALRKEHGRMPHRKQRDGMLVCAMTFTSSARHHARHRPAHVNAQPVRSSLAPRVALGPSFSARRPTAHPSPYPRRCASRFDRICTAAFPRIALGSLGRLASRLLERRMYTTVPICGFRRLLFFLHSLSVDMQRT
jgi:hypothetical protein